MSPATVQVLSLTVGMTANDANTAGTANSFRNRFGEQATKIRYWLDVANDANFAIQVSPDGTSWSNASDMFNANNTTVTGVYEGPTKSVRVYTEAVATPGTATCKVAGIIQG